MDRSSQDGWAHLISDLGCERGRRELVEFGRRIRLARRIHRDSTYAEHYDIRGLEIEKARMAGARMVSRRELACILRRKRQIEDPASSSGLTKS